MNLSSSIVTAAVVGEKPLLPHQPIQGLIQLTSQLLLSLSCFSSDVPSCSVVCPARECVRKGVKQQESVVLPGDNVSTIVNDEAGEIE